MTAISRPLPHAVRRILRVDHGGEQGAILIYRMQIAVARWRCPDLLPFLTRTIDHEIGHLAAFRALIDARGYRPCRVMAAWALGGGLLGLLTGLFGRQGILVCTAAVEGVVHGHLDQQITYLDRHDPEVAGVVRAILVEELEHLDFALSQLDRNNVSLGLLSQMIEAATEGLIWLSTRGDSSRLNALLPPAK